MMETPSSGLAGIGLFFREILANRRVVGAAAPSGPALGRRMANKVPKLSNGQYVVELGAGTGAITHQLLKSGICENQLVSVERSEAMSLHLRHRFPGITIIEGDAARLKELLEGDHAIQSTSVSCIVSGLPLRSLPPAVVEAIVREAHLILAPGGRFIQFTYDIRRGPNPTLSAFSRSDTSVVWANFPPARVDVYEKP
ncbi:methyltransferase domain-containing protein [Verrucomicrobia bacterium]|nr:methyltransferase domain-containing protein [Verrucomicrobiota bacterium]MDB4664922.1 methyltransferase domain-containing protein [Verrucomicrobiota bacterium]